MGQLKQKRPASSKKTGRKRAAKKNKRQEEQQSEVITQKAVQKVSEPKSPAAPAKKASPKAIKPSGRQVGLSLWSKGIQFLREVKIELKKVSWPSRKETMASTVVVIILVIIVSAFLGLVDIGLSSLIGVILH